MKKRLVDFSCEDNFSCDELIAYARENAERVQRNLQKFNEEQLLDIEEELNSFLWDEVLLGKYKSKLDAMAYHTVVVFILGAYKIRKRFYLKQLGKTEQELLKDVVKELYDQAARSACVNGVFYPQSKEYVAFNQRQFAKSRKE